jgi:hypothetical protein
MCVPEQRDVRPDVLVEANLLVRDALMHAIAWRQQTRLSSLYEPLWGQNLGERIKAPPESTSARAHTAGVSAPDSPRSLM